MLMAGGLGTVAGTTGMVLGKQAMHADPQRSKPVMNRNTGYPNGPPKRHLFTPIGTLQDTYSL